MAWREESKVVIPRNWHFRRSFFASEFGRCDGGSSKDWSAEECRGCERRLEQRLA
jgi:hypothetical protein